MTGKKLTSAAMANLEGRPKPSHTTSSGAIAKTGSACATTSSGPTERSARREPAITKAATMPPAVPISRPPTISPRVVSASGQITGQRVTSVVTTRLGAGSRNAGMAKARTAISQTRSVTMPVTISRDRQARDAAHGRETSLRQHESLGILEAEPRHRVPSAGMIRFRFNGFVSTHETSQPGSMPGHPDGPTDLRRFARGTQALCDRSPRQQAARTGAARRPI